MKWFRNRRMLNETLEENNKKIEKTTSEKTRYLLKDYNNLIKDHLELLERLEVLEKENKELKEYSFLLELSKQHEESKNEILKMSVKDTYDTSQEIIGELTQENKELWETIEMYNHKFAEVERKKCDLIQENEKLKNDLEFIFKHFSIPPKCFIYEEKRKVYYYEEFSDYVEFTLEQFETYKTIWNKLKEVKE